MLRHAKAVAATDPLADIARPLTERGERDARLIGQRLRQAYQPSSIVSSPATRAVQTAELGAEAMNYAREQITLDQRLYLAAPAAIMAVIGQQSAAITTLLLVGHNPGLTELVHRFLPGFDVTDLPTCAVVGLEFDALADWPQAANATPALAYYDFPMNPSSPLRSR